MAQRGRRTGIRRRLGAGLVAMGVFALLGALLAPSAAADPLDNVFEPCESTLQGGRDALAKVSAPIHGATVEPGQAVNVDLVWEPDWWSEVDVVMDCVFVNGEVVESLSAAEKPGVNDGLFEHEYAIPASAVSGDEVCDVGRVSGDPTQANPTDSTHKSNVVCFTVGGATTTTGDGGGSTTTTTIGTTTTTTSTTSTTLGAVVLPTVVVGESTTTTEAPTTTVAVLGVTVERELARTGTDARTLLGLAGLMMLVGGIGVLYGESDPAVEGRRR